MKLILRRDQRAAMLGAPIFSLTVRADLTGPENDAVKRYKLGGTVLFSSETMTTPNAGVLELAARVALKETVTVITAGYLTEGKTIECRDIADILEAEERVKVAARNFKQVLDAAMQFGGEEVIEL